MIPGDEICQQKHQVTIPLESAPPDMYHFGNTHTAVHVSGIDPAHNKGNLQSLETTHNLQEFYDPVFLFRPAHQYGVTLDARHAVRLSDIHNAFNNFRHYIHFGKYGETFLVQDLFHVFL